MFIFPLAILEMDNISDKHFMEQLYIDNENLMYFYAFKFVNKHNDAEDIVNDTCLKLIKKIPLLRTLECYVLKSYIVSTIERTAINYIKKQSRINSRSVYDYSFETLQSDDDGPVELFAQYVKNENLQKAIELLPSNYKQLLQLKYFDAFDDEAIAKTIGISKDSVRVYVNRARKKLKAILEGGDFNE